MVTESARNRRTTPAATSSTRASRATRSASDLQHRHRRRVDRARVPPRGHARLRSSVAVGLQSPALAIVLAFVPMLFVVARLLASSTRRSPTAGRPSPGPPRRSARGRAGWAAGRSSLADDPRHGQPRARSPGRTSSCSSAPTASAATRPAAGSCSSASPGSSLMTVICYRGIELSAKHPERPARHRAGHARSCSPVVAAGRGLQRARRRAVDPPGAVVVQPVRRPRWSSFTAAFLLMLFIYWGWDTTVVGQRGDADRSRHVPAGRPCSRRSSCW